MVPKLNFDLSFTAPGFPGGAPHVCGVLTLLTGTPNQDGLVANSTDPDGTPDPIVHK